MEEGNGYYVLNWTSLCGPVEFHAWNAITNNFGACFQKLILKSIFFTILSIISAYYVGKHTKFFVRSQSQKGVLYLRLASCYGSLILSVMTPSLMQFYLHTPFYWVDILSDSIEIFGWLMHIVYVTSLCNHLTRGTRGPRPAIAAWIMVLLFYISYARSSWFETQNDNSDSFNMMFKGISTTHLILQIIYLFTLFPEGMESSLDYRELPGEADEQTPLLGSNIHYRRFQEAIDPYHLGVAEDGVNNLSYLSFYWVNQMMKKGAQACLLSVDDLYDLPTELQSTVVFQMTNKEMMMNQLAESGDSLTPDEPNIRKTNFPLTKALHKCFGIKFYTIGLLKFLSDALSFAGPLLLHELVSFIDGKTDGAWRSYGAGVGLCVASTLGALCLVHYNYQLAKLTIQLRGSLVSAVFWKVQHVSAGSLSEFTSGEIVNLMSTDIDRILGLCQSFHAFWSLPLQLLVTLLLLYKQMGIASLVGVAISLLLLPINRILAVKIAEYSRKMMHFKDRRVNFLTEVLSFIKAVKLNCWENLFKGTILDERYSEVKALSGIKYLDAGCVYFWATTPVLIPILAFCTYAALGHAMEPARVFTAVALFNMLTVPLNAFPWVINGLVEAWVSIKRIERLMKIHEANMNEYYTPSTDMINIDQDSAIVLENASFTWVASSTCGNTIPVREEVHPPDVTFSDLEAVGPSTSFSEGNTQRFALRNLNLRINNGSSVAIVGGVGSGKTALLHAILGEIENVSGAIYVTNVHKGFGFASQEPWLQNTSIKENILLGQNFDSSRYRSVLSSCALQEELQLMPKRDETRCGDNGAALSGGQKARVALARALYQNKKIYLLDDILSAVDAPVARHIMYHGVHNFLADKTVILVTHHLTLLTKMNWIIEMEDGIIKQQGTPKDILPKLVDIRELLDDWWDSNSPSACSGAIRRQANQPRISFYDELDYSFKITSTSVEEEEEPTDEGETRSYGELTSAVFLTYLSAVGGGLATLIFFSMVLMQATQNLSDVWLAKWVSVARPPSNNSDEFSSSWDSLPSVLLNLPERLYQPDTSLYAPLAIHQLNSTYDENVSSWSTFDPTYKFYIIIYGVFAISNVVFAFPRAFLFAYGGLCAAKKLHKHLLDAVLYAKIEFFDNNLLGRILNRFSTDVYSIDNSLPFELNILLKFIFSLLGSILVTVYGLPWILLVYTPLIFIYYKIQQFYRHTSRDLKRIYALSLSPLYNHFTETLKGLNVIRAARSGHRFMVHLEAYLEQNQRSKFCIELASQWLQFRLQLIGVGVLGGVTAMSLLQNYLTKISAGVVGLVVSYALTVNGLLNGVVTFITRTEQELISVERVHQYLTGAPKEVDPNSSPPVALPPKWPLRAGITFENVFLKYHDHNPYSLRDVSFEIKSCEKVGIVGRTGAGKTSIFMALFRMVNLSRGRIAIDGIDISEISLKKLRSSLSIVTQDILLFSGTIKENLDPRGDSSVEDIERVLQMCRLTNAIEDLGGLDAILKKGGDELSAGQKQLFCLARALLCNTKIVCIDEGTSMLDNEMDLQIQTVIRESFRNKTVLIIAHRIHTVRDCDRILSVRDGEVSEISVSELFEERRSLFDSRLV